MSTTSAHEHAAIERVAASAAAIDTPAAGALAGGGGHLAMKKILAMVALAIACFLAISTYQVVKSIESKTSLTKVEQSYFPVLIKADASIAVMEKVSDVNMPNMDGLTMAEKIRGELGNKTVNIVMLTTENSPIMKERGKAAGIKGWIVKPFKGDAVLATFKKLVEA